MTHHHPDSQWLIEYAAGTLSESQALCVTTHLSYCEYCSNEIGRLNDIGATVFENQPASAPVDPALFGNIMSRINDTPVQTVDQQMLRRAHAVAKSRIENIPSAIDKLIPGGMNALSWKKMGKHIRIANLERLDEQRDVSLHKLLPGGTVAEHDHKGQEITVVLSGSFSDQDGVYRAGDFIVRQPGETHRPMVTDDEECICLSVCDAPVKFTGMLTRLLNPLVAYQHKH